MLKPRIIPCLLVHNKGLVKTTKFKDPKYVGDPINAVKIFNEKEADELTVLDIDATVEKREPNFEMIKNLAVECRMPLCYGGGIKTVEQALYILSLGVEKIALSSVIFENPNLITEIAEKVGNQSVVVILDVKKKRIGSKYETFIHNATKKIGECPVDIAIDMAKRGAGEIVINSVDNDGVMKGYDIKLLEKIKEEVLIPVTVLGGAGSHNDISQLISKYRIIGASAGSLFVFKGKYRAVLINYPTKAERELLFNK